MITVPWWQWALCGAGIAAFLASLAWEASLKGAWQLRRRRRFLAAAVADVDERQGTVPYRMADIVMPLHDAHIDRVTGTRCTWCWPEDGDPIPAPLDCLCRADCTSVACIAPLRPEGFPA